MNIKAISSKLKGNPTMVGYGVFDARYMQHLAFLE